MIKDPKQFKVADNLYEFPRPPYTMTVLVSHEMDRYEVTFSVDYTMEFGYNIADLALVVQQFFEPHDNYLHVPFDNLGKLVYYRGMVAN